MNNIWWQTKGQGNVHLVLLHGWGLNAEVWRCIDEELSSHFTLHLVDLPGFGRSRGFGAMSLADMAEAVLRQAPDKAIWLGWSLGVFRRWSPWRRHLVLVLVTSGRG